MSETPERFCPHCGRANPASMLRCINCGQRMTGERPYSDRASASVRGSAPLQLTHPEEETTIRLPWWQSDGAGTIPTPPQVRDEARRHAIRQLEISEREAENRRRYSEYLHEREKLRESRVAAEQELNGSATTATTLTHCPHCETELGEAGKTFSFCLHCGQDVPTVAAGGKPHRATAERTFAAVPSAQVTMQTTTHTVTVGAGVEGRTETRYTDATRTERTVAPGVAGVVSFFVPGVGQMLNGQTAKGVFLLLVFLVLVPLLSAGFLGFLVQGASAIDAYRVAQRRRDGELVREDEWDLGSKT